MNSKTKLSIIVPTLNQKAMVPLIESIKAIKRDDIELVVVNQTGAVLSVNIKNELNIPLIDKMVNKMPASDARNFGAELASGSYLFFLDDDAFLYSGLVAIEKLLLLLDKQIDLIVVQRGEIVDDAYVSYWPKKPSKIDYKNFSRIIIEWNVIIRRDVFLQIGGFPSIGAGSQHAALSGEAFVLFAKTMLQKCSTCLFHDVKIAHPSLFNTQKSIASILGYAYGSGYAVGLSFSYFNNKQKIYWILRLLCATCRDLLLTKNKHNIGKNIVQVKYRISLAKCKLYGFFDCLRKQKPRDASWLKKESMHLNNEQA